MVRGHKSITNIFPGYECTVLSSAVSDNSAAVSDSRIDSDQFASQTGCNSTRSEPSGCLRLYGIGTFRPPVVGSLQSCTSLFREVSGGGARIKLTPSAPQPYLGAKGSCFLSGPFGLPPCSSSQLRVNVSAWRCGSQRWVTRLSHTSLFHSVTFTFTGVHAI